MPILFVKESSKFTSHLNYYIFLKKNFYVNIGLLRTKNTKELKLNLKKAD
jgi:hypothetical protein